MSDGYLRGQRPQASRAESGIDDTDAYATRPSERERLRERNRRLLLRQFDEETVERILGARNANSVAPG